MMHVSAMSDKTKDGEVLSVQESRLTGFFTHVLVLASLMALSVIKVIPLPVLYGVFLFMGKAVKTLLVYRREAVSHPTWILLMHRCRGTTGSAVLATLLALLHAGTNKSVHGWFFGPGCIHLTLLLSTLSPFVAK